jgi:hypothetical protein
VRIWTQGPSAAAGALTPTLPVTPRATTYRQVVIFGQPGTLGVPAPKPSALTQTSQTRDTQPSWRAPDVIFPQLYYTPPINMHPPVSLFRDNQMPVPAVGNFGGVGQLAPPAMKRRGMGGQKAIDWPAVVQRFPNRVTARFNGGN